jgi:hypothetical protein
MTTYFRTQQAANYMSMSKSWLEKERVRGAGPRYTTAGRVVLYAVEDLDRWLAKRASSAGDRALDQVAA